MSYNVSMPNIDIKRLRVSYFKRKEETNVIDTLSTHFDNGTFNVILGYSGCGKSTLLRTLMGLMPYEGDIYVDGVDIKNIPIQERNFSFVSQEYVLYPNLTIFDNIAFPLKMRNTPRNEIIKRVNEIAEKFNLTACLSRKPWQISGGQQQKVCIARALIKKPVLCLFDEPFSNLDQQSRSEAIYYLKTAINELGITVIYVTHSVSEATSLADKIYIMNDKVIEAELDPDSFLESPNEVAQSLLKMEFNK